MSLIEETRFFFFFVDFERRKEKVKRGKRIKN